MRETTGGPQVEGYLGGGLTRMWHNRVSCAQPWYSLPIVPIRGILFPAPDKEGLRPSRSDSEFDFDTRYMRS